MAKEKHSALIVGMGRFGRAAAERLVALNWDVVGVDRDPEVIREIQDRLEHIVELDASDEEALATLGVPDFEVCIVSRAESIEGSILLVLNLQNLGAKVIVAKAASEHHARVLRRLGVQRIVFPERDAGVRLAEGLDSPHLVQWVKLWKDTELAVLRVPESRVGTQIKQWRELSRSALQIVAHLTAAGKPLELNPETGLGLDEILIVVGPTQAILALKGM